MKKVKMLTNRVWSLRRDTLYLNSLFMMASMAIISGSGFFFWIIVAHFYKDAQVGLATAIISVITFIMNVSILGLNYSIIRFIPKSKQKNLLLSDSFLTITVASIVCAAAFLLFVPFFSPSLLFVRSGTNAFFFVLFTITVSIDYFTESIFIGLRAGKYILLKNVLVSLCKILLPALFVGFGAIGVFISWALSLTSALLISSYILIKHYNFRFAPSFNKATLHKLMSFSMVNFVVGLLGIVPGLILPIFITNTINPQTSAYFYIAFMIANFLYVIPFATAQSLFAEGSYDEEHFTQSIFKACKLIFILLIPAIIVLLFLGNFILCFFGKTYSTEGIHLLQLLALSGIPVAFNYLGLTILNIKRAMKSFFAINFLGVVIILVLSYLFREYTLTGIGFAWLIGQVCKNIMYAAYIVFTLPKGAITTICTDMILKTKTKANAKKLQFEKVIVENKFDLWR